MPVSRLGTLALALALALPMAAFRSGAAPATAASAAAAAADDGAPDPIGYSGTDWSRLTPDARDAYLIGFLAGAAAQQATNTRAATPAPGKVIAARARALKSEGRLTFPYRENVYRAHIDDYFFYRNRRVEPLIKVIVDMNIGNAHPQ